MTSTGVEDGHVRLPGLTTWDKDVEQKGQQLKSKGELQPKGIAMRKCLHSASKAFGLFNLLFSFSWVLVSTVPPTNAQESAQAQNKVPDYTKGEPSICEVHHRVMDKRILPFAHGMIPMNRAEDTRGEWARRLANYPHPGDGVPATSIVMPGSAKGALAYVCPQCVAAKKADDAKTSIIPPVSPPAISPVGKIKTIINPQLLQEIELELARLQAAADQEKSPIRPPLASQVAYCLLVGLATQGALVETIPPGEEQIFGLEKRGGKQTRLFSVAGDRRVLLQDDWIQDKAGTYILRTATFYSRQQGQWMAKGKGVVIGKD